MRSVFVGMFMVLAGAAVAADWSVEAFGTWSKLTDINPSATMTITGDAGGNRTSPMPDINTAAGGGLTIISVPQHGRGMFGIDLEFLSGSESIDAPLVDVELGAPVVDASISAFAVSGFFAGVIPWISGESYSSALGVGFGLFRSSSQIDLSLRKRVFDPETEETTIIDVSESASTSSSTGFINVFLREELRISRKFHLAATLGYHGIPSKRTAVSTGSLTGSFTPEFAGPFVRLGVRIDI